MSIKDDFYPRGYDQKQVVLAARQDYNNKALAEANLMKLSGVNPDESMHFNADEHSIGPVPQAKYFAVDDVAITILRENWSLLRDMLSAVQMPVKKTDKYYYYNQISDMEDDVVISDNLDSAVSEIPYDGMARGSETAPLFTEQTGYDFKYNDFHLDPELAAATASERFDAMFRKWQNVVLFGTKRRRHNGNFMTGMLTNNEDVKVGTVATSLRTAAGAESAFEAVINLYRTNNIPNFYESGLRPEILVSTEDYAYWARTQLQSVTEGNFRFTILEHLQGLPHIGNIRAYDAIPAGTVMAFINQRKWFRIPVAMSPVVIPLGQRTPNSGYKFEIQAIMGGAVFRKTMETYEGHFQTGAVRVVATGTPGYTAPVIPEH